MSLQDLIPGGIEPAEEIDTTTDADGVATADGLRGLHLFDVTADGYEPYYDEIVMKEDQELTIELEPAE